MLMGNFYSYQSISDFEKEIRYSCDTITILENSKLADDDKRPPFTIYTISIPHFKHLGCGGELHASFFNNRLQLLSFRPEHLEEEKYFKNINKELNMNLTYEKQILFDHVRIFKWASLNFSAIDWIDMRLQKEQNDWIEKYS